MDYTFKIVVIGDGSVGKTSLVHRAIDNKFQDSYKETIGIDLFNHSFKIEFQGQTMNITLLIYDLGGQDYWKKLRADFYNRTKGMLLVYDVTRPETLQNLDNWYSEAVENIGRPVPGIILGNKSDLQINVSDELVDSTLSKLKFNHYNVSAKTGSSVLDSFQEICKEILQEDVK